MAWYVQTQNAGRWTYGWAVKRSVQQLTVCNCLSPWSVHQGASTQCKACTSARLSTKGRTGLAAATKLCAQNAAVLGWCDTRQLQQCSSSLTVALCSGIMLVYSSPVHFVWIRSAMAWLQHSSLQTIAWSSGLHNSPGSKCHTPSCCCKASACSSCCCWCEASRNIVRKWPIFEPMQQRDEARRLVHPLLRTDELGRSHLAHSHFFKRSWRYLAMPLSTLR